MEVIGDAAANGVDQNGEKALLLLRAQRAAYRSGKRLRLLRLIGSVLPAVVAPALLLWLPDSKPYLSGVAAVWAVVSLVVLKRGEKQWIQTGARLQEEFDCAVLPLSWNRSMAGERVAPERAFQLAEGVDLVKEKLKDWYPAVDGADGTKRCLLLQRANLAWDHRLRREYTWIVAGLGALLFVGYLLLALLLDQSLQDYVLGLLIPSLPAMLHAGDVFLIQVDAAAEGEASRKLADQLLTQHARSNGAVGPAECRSLQDRVFAGRRAAAMVPGWWYWLRRSSYEKAMAYGVKSAGE